MWKEKYRTGNKIIDEQHMGLFGKSDELLQAIRKRSEPEVYSQIINFLVDYVKVHFECEESFQRSIQYVDYEKHKAAHVKFTNTVHNFAEKLEENNYPIEIVKELAGTLTAWLTYHVVYTDLKMVQGKSDSGEASAMTNIQILTHSMKETLEALTGQPAAEVKEYDAVGELDINGIQIGIDIIGDVNGKVTYVYTEDAAKNLFESMTMQQPDSIDEMVYSALSEITNITTGKTAVNLGGNGYNCDIKPPQILKDSKNNNFGGVILDTGNGKIKVSAALDNY